MTSADLLIDLARAEASPELWAELVDRHGSRLWAVCRAAAGSELADDAFQESLIAIRCGARRFRPGPDPEASAVGWMVTVAHCTAIDLVRREARRSKQRGNTMPIEPVSVTPSDTEHDSTAQSAMRALEQLPERHQQVIRLRLLGGLDATQTASVLGCPAEHVRVRLHRALELLRDRCIPVGAAALPVATLEDSLRLAANPPHVLPASAKAIAITSFTTPAITAGLSLGTIMAISTIGCGIAAALVFTVVMPMKSVGAAETAPAPTPPVVSTEEAPRPAAALQRKNLELVHVSPDEAIVTLMGTFEFGAIKKKLTKLPPYMTLIAHDIESRDDAIRLVEAATGAHLLKVGPDFFEIVLTKPPEQAVVAGKPLILGQRAQGWLKHKQLTFVLHANQLDLLHTFIRLTGENVIVDPTIENGDNPETAINVKNGTFDDVLAQLHVRAEVRDGVVWILPLAPVVPTSPVEPAKTGF